MTREMWVSMAVTRSRRCSSIPPPVPRLSKRAPEGSTRSISRVPHWPHESSPNSFGDLQRWQKIFPRTFDMAFNDNARSSLPRPCARRPSSLIFVEPAPTLPPQPARVHVLPEQRARAVLRVAQLRVEHVEDGEAHVQP